MSQILILHAPEAIKEARALQKDLEGHCFNSDVFLDVMNQAPVGTPRVVFFDQIVQARAVVIVIASPALFTDDSLVSIADRAVIIRKFVPVLSGFPGTELPLWFSMYSNINLNVQDRKRELTRLVMSLISRGL